MDKKKVTILGASGMLGSMLINVFSANDAYDITATVRNAKALENGKRILPKIHWKTLDAEETDVKKITETIGNASWIINCIGIIKPYIHDDNPSEVERALKVNALFPHYLAQAAGQTGIKILQIATDCVYSGQKGSYVESDPHDAWDVYGKTKSLGEAWFSNIYSIRCSIIGPEPKSFVSFLEWFLKQPKNAKVNGYTNHQWNGITTLHFGRLCEGIIRDSAILSHLQHIVPKNSISKSELLKVISKECNREDVTITPMEARTIINRTLATNEPQRNHALWNSAGYDNPPTIEQMISELATFDYKWKGELN